MADMLISPCRSFADHIIPILKFIAKATNIFKIIQSERVQARQRLRNGYNFNEEQVTALIPFQKVESASSARSALSRLSRLRRELRKPNASDSNTTRLANEKEERLRHENRDINYPDHFALESVKERLDGYDISNKPDLQALADVMIMFCIRPVEVKNLRISDGSVTGCEISRSDAISSGQLKDPGTPGIKCFRAFLKKPRGVSYDQSKAVQTLTKTNHGEKSAESYSWKSQTVNALETAIQSKLGTPFNNVRLAIHQTSDEALMQPQALISSFFNYHIVVRPLTEQFSVLYNTSNRLVNEELICITEGSRIRKPALGIMQNVMQLDSSYTNKKKRMASTAFDNDF
ncbi:hypothetical protein RhiirC2_865826 [Rhizophagus irregularis]|uniref:Uncharacterized protein n=1 Tax=Rhizophagus irregularis TaxID=588596 RepID=A0A2N1NAY5_9GLOM|nr:hypothetical protein RhiirC2_865826 [Rhizophagus irregularis]